MSDNHFDIRFPVSENHLDQDMEFCIIEDGTCKRNIRFHDYGDIYSIKGLYEYIFYDVLKCNSPVTVCSKIVETLKDTDMDPYELRVLDVGAGNGMVGEELRSIGASKVIGVDIIEEAREATLRDRPDIYDNYLVMDLTEMDDGTRDELMSHRLNCMTTVAALGFGDIPPKAFSEGFNLIEDGGIIAFNIRDKFVEDAASSGFSGLIEEIESESILDLQVKEKYCHRFDVGGNEIDYYVMAGIKNKNIPDELVQHVIEICT